MSPEIQYKEYKEDKTTEECIFKLLPKVSDQSNEMLCGMMTLKELHKALQNMASGKAPGLDELPVDGSASGLN